MSENFGSTKFWLTLLSLVGAYILVVIGKLDANQWITATLGAVGTYTVGNVAQKFSDK